MLASVAPAGCVGGLLAPDVLGLVLQQAQAWQPGWEGSAISRTVTYRAPLRVTEGLPEGCPLHTSITSR